MSKKLAHEGWFRAWITASGIDTKTIEKNGNIQFIADLEIVEEYDFDSQSYIDITATEEREISGYFTLYSSKYPDNILFFGDQLKRALDWNGDMKVLNTSDYSKVCVLIHVEEEEFEKKKRLKVTRIGHAEDTPGGGAATKAEDTDLDAAMAKFTGAQRQFMGGDKPKTVPGKPIVKPVIPKTAAATAPPTENKVAMEAAGEQAKTATDAAKAEAEYNAMPPKEKKAFNKAKKDAVTAAKAAVSVPGRKATTTAPAAAVAPPVAVAAVAPVDGVEISVQQELVEALDLPASCNQDEAWAACEANAHPDKVAVLAEAWTKAAVVLRWKNEAEIDAANGWPELRDEVLKNVIDSVDNEIPF